jgi:gamma-glutamyl:cysteine ligase YbdK (ATP-grasp superfamily)
MEKSLIGIEVELLLVNQAGQIISCADQLISDKRNPGNFVPELSNNIVELNSDPYPSLKSLESNIKKLLLLLSDIAASYGAYTIPTSATDPSHEPDINTDKKRYHYVLQGLGEPMGSDYASLCGTHIHLDKKENIVAQYNLMTSLDPSLVFLNSTPYFLGKDGYNSCRLNAIRNEIFINIPILGELQDYLYNEDALQELLNSKYQAWANHLNLDKDISSIFDPDNTSWGPVKVRENTVETRAQDASIPSLIVSAAALYKGVTALIFDNNLEVIISKNDDYYEITNTFISLPNFKTLSKLESHGIQYGLCSDDIRQYLQFLVAIAEDGLVEKEKKYLNPLKKMLEAKKTLSSIYHQFVQHNFPEESQITSAAAHKLNQFISAIYLLDLKGKLDIDNLFEMEISDLMDSVLKLPA